ncbi:MAG: class I SAM-dependent methyltransferase [Kiritimatiellae bacterium]|nr:class I SAM-dependent methyltransferase [Kiritimatiellia bacterium]
MKCRVCDGEHLELVLDLGIQPWGNHFLLKEEIGREPCYPLRLVYCANCHAAQLDYTVPKEVMFKDHTYVSGTTATLRRHFADTAKYVNDHFFHSTPGKSVLDIGSNDGTQLLEYKALGYDVQGVESCERIARQAVKAGVPTTATFFNRTTAEKLGRKFNVINASGVFFHLEELHSVTEGIKTCLADDGVFVVQFLYMKQIMDNTAFDQVYHEHLLYYNVATIERLLQRHGLAAFDAYLSPIHGGSVILLATHSGLATPSRRLADMQKAEDQAGANELAAYRTFAVRATQTRDSIVAYVQKAKKAGKTIYGMGAPVKGNTLLNYCGLDTRYVDYLVEKNPMRANLYSPGMHIPVVLDYELRRQPDIYLVLAWNFKHEILARYSNLVHQGIEFYFPVNPRE